MIVVELVCGRCRRVLREVDEAELPPEWEGVIQWIRCMHCYLPRPKVFAEVAGRLAAEGRLVNMGAEMPWERLRVPAAKGRMAGHAVKVKVGDPGNV